MTTMDISATETGVTRLFHLDLPTEAVQRFTTQAGTGEWPLSYALGATKLRQSFVELVSIRDLGAMTLSQYMAEAHGVTGADFQEMRARIDALNGHVIVLPSQAFGQTAQTLTISAPLRWIGTFDEVKPDTKAKPIRTKSAEGSTRDTAGPEDPLAQGGSPLLRAIVIAATALTVGILIYAFTG